MTKQREMTDVELLNDLSEFISVRMKSFREQSHDGNWFEHKSHGDYDLWFIQAGTVRLTVDGAEHIAGPGDVVFFYPGIPYMASASAEGCRFVYVHFDFGIGSQQRILEDFPLAGVISRELIREEAVLFGKASLSSAAQSAAPGNRLYVKACLTAVLAKIIELHGQGRYAGTFRNGGAKRQSGRSLDVLQPVFQHIHNRLHEPIKMKELASFVGISEKYFITYFKKALGITPGQYIYQIRMNRAKDYLHARSYSVQQIAALLGYPDSFTFSKAFKKYYRVPPSKFE